MAITVNQSTDMPAGFVRLGRSNAENLDAATLEIGIATVDAGKGGKHLDPSMEGAAAWASGEKWFAPESSAAESQKLVLELGPRVTWHLKPNHPYWVHLRDGKGQRARDRMIWRAVRLPTSAPEPAVQPEPAEPSPPPDIAPVPESDAAPADAPPAEMRAAPATRSGTAEAQVGEDGKRSARSIFKIAAGLMGIYHWIGIAVAIVLLGFLLQFHKGNIDNVLAGAESLVEKIIKLVSMVDDKDAAVDPADETADDAPDKEKVTTKVEVTVQTDDVAGPGPPMTRAEVVPYLKEKPPAENALEEAGRAGDAGDQDAAFLLLKYAARSGSADAARLMAQLYDPVTFTSGGVVTKPNAEDAATWYEEAATKGDVDAMVRLGEMLKEGRLDRPDASEQSLQWLRKAAEAGSEKAKELPR